MAPLPLSTPAQPPSTTEDPSHQPTKKRNPTSPSTLHTTSLRTQHIYFHLRLTTASPAPAPAPTTNLDPLTIRSLLTLPLQTYLGVTGAAIPIDVLQSEGRDVWVRVAGRDGRAVQAGLAGWVGGVEGGLVPGFEEGKGGKVQVAWRVVGRGGVLGRGDGRGVFGVGEGE